MKYQIAGTVAHVGELESLGAKGTPKLTFTVSIGNDNYPNNVPLDLWKDAANNPPAVGQKIEAEFYLQGREWNGKHYVSLKCAGWKADEAAPVPRGKPTAKPSAPSANPAAALGLDDKDDGIPF